MSCKKVLELLSGGSSVYDVKGCGNEDVMLMKSESMNKIRGPLEGSICIMLKC